MKQKKIIGVYKITSPTNRVYVGSSVNMKERWASYRRMECDSQPRIFASLKKYGVDNHKFELITECSIEELLKLETYWGTVYNCLDRKAGLNISLPKDGEFYGGNSTEKKKRPPVKPESIAKRLATMAKMPPIVPWNKGIPWDEKTKAKLSASLKGRSTWNKGKTWSEESRRKMSESTMGAIAWNRRTILCLNTGVFYESSIEAAKYSKYSRQALNNMLGGVVTNKTSLQYV